MIQQLKDWLTCKKLKDQVRYLKIENAELKEKLQYTKQDRQFLRDINDRILASIAKNKYIKKKTVMVPTEKTMERIKEGKLCAACQVDLKKDYSEAI